MTARRPVPPPLHVGQVLAHRCDRFEVSAVRVTLPAVDVEHARLLAVREAHRRSGLPLWKPLIRQSLQFTTAERVCG